MGNQTTKTYRIDILLDDAQRQLDETTKRLRALDAQLDGLDRDSEAGKKLVAEMAATAKQVQALTGEVTELGDQLDHLKPGSIGALEAEVIELERAFKRTVVGSKEQEQALLALGRAKGQISALEDAISALNPKEKVAAFADFANGIVGGFSICTTAAQSWGIIGTDSAEEVSAAMQKMLVVMSALEAISKAGNSETLANVKNLYSMARGYLFAGEAASTSSKVVRGALAATGVGLIVLLVGTLIANWDSLTAKVGGSEKFFTKVKAVASGLFDSAIASVKNFAGVIGKLFEGDFSGALSKAKHLGAEVGKAFESGYQEVVEDANRKLFAKQAEALERQLKVQQAGGYESVKLQREILEKKLAAQKQGNEAETKAYHDAADELRAFDAAQAKKRREDALAYTLARLGAVVALEQAKGQESYRTQLDLKRKELAGLLAAETQNEALIKAKKGEIAVFKAQHEAELADKARAALVLAQQNELALWEKQGKDTLALRLTFAEQLLATGGEANEKQRAQRDADYQALLLLEQEYNNRVREGLQANQEQRREVDAQGREVDRQLLAAGLEATTQLVLDHTDKASKKVPDLGRSILTSFFGIKPEDVEKVKAAFNQAFAEIGQAVSGSVNAMLTAGIQEADAQLQAVQQRLSELDTKLSEASSARQNTEQQLAAATGARKTYLLAQLEKERAAEQRLAGEKAKAAKEEKQAQETRAKLEKEQQQISAASTAIEAVLLGIKAAQQIVNIASKGFSGWDNIALAIASTATLAAGIFAVKNAAKQFEAGGVVGADGVLRGPRHAAGGIPFTVGGVPGFEAEGGEGILPVDSTANNAAIFELLRTQGRTRTLTPVDYINAIAGDAHRITVKPPPASYFEAGGILNRAGAPAGGYASAGNVSALAEKLDRNNALLAQLVGVSSATAENTGATAQHAQATAKHTEAVKNYGPHRTVRSEHELLEEQARLSKINQLINYTNP